MIIESANLPAKLEAGLGTDNVILTKFNEFSTGIKSYVLMRTHTNLGITTGTQAGERRHDIKKTAVR